MSLRTLLLLGALAIAAPGCVVYSMEPGTPTADGSVYLGFDLFDAKGKPDHEHYDIGQQLGAFSSIRLVSDGPVAITRVHVILADGARWDVPAPRTLSGSSQWMAVPQGPRAIHSLTVVGQSSRKGLAKIEVYGRR